MNPGDPNAEAARCLETPPNGIVAKKVITYAAEGFKPTA